MTSQYIIRNLWPTPIYMNLIKVPKNFMIPFIILVLVTLKYSMFVISFYYIIYNLFQYHLYRKEIKNSENSDDE